MPEADETPGIVDEHPAVEHGPDETEQAAVPRDPAPVRMESRWVAPVALALGIIATAVAVWAATSRDADTAAPSSDQIADAKTRACTAYATVRSAVALQTHADLGADPVAVQAVAANARLAMSSGAAYLHSGLDPATPPDLAAAIRTFADDLQDISMYAQIGVTNDDPAQRARLRNGETASARIAELCR